jgi:outer membrane protein assembly factor BamD (BamD/ComL family)
VSISVLALVVIAVILVLVIRSRIQANITAGNELFQAEIYLNYSDYGRAVEKLNSLIETYPGTKNSKEAYILLARAYFTQAKYDSAIYYADFFSHKYGGSDPILTCSALALQAASLEEKGKFSEAAEIYRKAAEKYPRKFTAPGYLLDAGRCYYLAGELTKAQDVFLKVIKAYPESDLVVRANEQLARAGGIPQKTEKPISLFK